MVSSEIRQILQKAAKIFVLAAAAWPCAGLSQPVSAPGAGDKQQQILDTIEAQSRDDVHSGELIDPLAALGLLYQESGEHLLAAAAIERARDVVRVNYGLHAFEQAPLLRQSIDIQRASGNHEAAWKLEQELLALVGRHPEDLRTVAILREIADERMNVLERYIAGDFPAEIVLGCYFAPSHAPRACASGSQRVATRSILSEARGHYEQAIAVMLSHGLYSSDELRELEMAILRTNYVYGEHLSTPSRYELGKQRLRRLLDYEIADSNPHLNQVRWLVQLADWELIYSNNGVALEMYERAHERLEQERIPQASIDELFSPDMPAVLPAFLPNPLVSEESPQATGFIDVAFEISRYGKSRRIEILDTTMNAARASRARLARLISRSQFRPRVTDGRFANASPVVVRYYLSE